MVAFDVIETLFSLEPLRSRLESAGLPGHLLETWFAQLLRDGFALSATGVYRPFRDVATAGLERLFDSETVDSAQIDRIISGFAELDAHPDAAPAIQLLHDAGLRIVTLTNGSASVTERLLERAGLRDRVERMISVDEVKRWKPHQEVYLHRASVVEVEPRHLALIAAHPWDIHGARRAGLMAGYVGRDGKPFPSIMDAPHVTGVTLVEVAEQLVAG
ncbi:haloacid dehalogenase type II [Nitratireductor sp. GCM10026969]|uniref:haloacid dehalogenase type II n=1 Tax=Nitratireductor sp. GCM10026969 TaxID=3252645 RepID=UPI00361B99FF